jgi:hypothetical protein
LEYGSFACQYYNIRQLILQMKNKSQIGEQKFDDAIIKNKDLEWGFELHLKTLLQHSYIALPAITTVHTVKSKGGK